MAYPKSSHSPNCPSCSFSSCSNIRIRFRASKHRWKTNINDTFCFHEMGLNFLSTSDSSSEGLMWYLQSKEPCRGRHAYPSRNAHDEHTKERLHLSLQVEPDQAHTSSYEGICKIRIPNSKPFSCIHTVYVQTHAKNVSSALVITQALSTFHGDLQAPQTENEWLELKRIHIIYSANGWAMSYTLTSYTHQHSSCVFICKYMYNNMYFC